MLSVLIITKNEEELIADCIKSIKDIADEVIVLDANSTDKTREIAEKLGAKVVVNKFIDFADQRNFGFRQSQGDWVLYLDSDERATEEFRCDLKSTISSYDENSQIGGYYIKRKTYFYGKDWGLTDKVQRLFNKKNFIEWVGVLHETPKIKGDFGEISAPVLHYTHRDLSLMVDKTNEWSKFEADLRFKTNHPKMNVLRFVRVMATAFFRSYIGEKGYKNGTAGLVEAMYQAFSMFITYAKLWER